MLINMVNQTIGTLISNQSKLRPLNWEIKEAFTLTHCMHSHFVTLLYYHFTTHLLICTDSVTRVKKRRGTELSRGMYACDCVFCNAASSLLVGGDN